ncbi:hypothetical protein Tco_1234759 [Tanacetum coccineum]
MKEKKDKKSLVTGTNGEEGYLLSVDVELTSSVKQRNEFKVTEAFANFDRHSIASKYSRELTLSFYWSLSLRGLTEMPMRQFLSS